MEGHTTRAGLAFAVSLFAWTVIEPHEIAGPCEAPIQRAAVGGYTTVVSCRADDSAANLEKPRAETNLRGPARRLFGHAVDVNCSDPLTLQTLAGIGPARAQAIIDERSRGRYLRVDDLMRVRGIGPKTLARLRGDLVVENPPVENGRPSVESQGCRTNS